MSDEYHLIDYGVQMKKTKNYLNASVIFMLGGKKLNG
jgi:hypothetical protein